MYSPNGSGAKLVALSNRLNSAPAYRRDQTNGWGARYWKAVHNRNLYSKELARFRQKYPGHPDDPLLVSRIRLCDGQIESMNAVSPSARLQANIAAAGGVPNRHPHGKTTKATPDRFYAGVAHVAGEYANFDGDIADALLAAPANAISNLFSPGSGRFHFNTEPYFEYDPPPTFIDQIHDLPNALSIAGTDLYNHPLYTFLLQGQYMDPNAGGEGVGEAWNDLQTRLPASADTTPLLPPEETGTYVPEGGGVSVSKPRSWRVAQVEGKKVYQRSDLIDPNRKDMYGRTNVQRMKEGYAPIGPDGRPIHLHHMVQEDDGPLAEVTQTFHQTNGRALHIDGPRTPSRINRGRFGRWKQKKYWPTRAKDFQP